MEWLLIAASAVVLTVGWVKIVAIVNAIRWLRRNGAGFLAELKSLPPHVTRNPDGIYALYRRHNGDFFPFGVKDHRLREMTGKWPMLELARNELFRYQALVRLATAIVVCAVGLLLCESSKSVALELVAALLCIMMFVMNTAIVIELIFGSIFLTDYMKYFHAVDTQMTLHQRSRLFSTESNYFLWLGIKRLFVLTMNISLFGVGASALGVVAWGAFHFPDDNFYKGAGSAHSFAELGRLIAMIIYWTTTTITTVGYGDIYPVSIWGYFVAIGMHVDSYFLVTFAAAVFWTTRSN